MRGERDVERERGEGEGDEERRAHQETLPEASASSHMQDQICHMCQMPGVIWEQLNGLLDAAVVTALGNPALTSSLMMSASEGIFEVCCSCM